MLAVRKRGRVRVTGWILIPSAVAASLLGSGGPAGASNSPSVAAAPLANVVSVAGNNAGTSFCAVRSTGHVDCWGENRYGELGDGTTTNSDVPVAAVGIGKATAVTSGSDGEGFCAVLSTGHVDCWGVGGVGELGNGTTTNSDVPVAVKNISTATAVTSGNDGDGFCAVLSSGHVDCWGYNGAGELGNGTTTTASDVPVAVQTIGNANALIGNGGGNFCAVLSTGDVDCWGYNGDGQLGNGTAMDSDVPMAAIGISTATAVSGGGLDVCALLSTSHVDCWGYNYYGELGNGTTTSSPSDVPVAVKNISTATAVTDGLYGVCAVLSTGHVDCWGYNRYGELGDGTTTNSDVPVAVHVISNTAAVIAGLHDFCALLSTGHVDCWGYNAYGELGNGTTTNSDVPVAVLAAS
jgi:alpha-tubulin suppressor-like RCC1 family protein